MSHATPTKALPTDHGFGAFHAPLLRLADLVSMFDIPVFETMDRTVSETLAAMALPAVPLAVMRLLCLDLM